ncbi:MAG: response regulator transcription factor [Scytonema sp. PMC 1070.18]|nr:response regulator transcription factor [Scytonema sp. PMC 1070.18]
MLPSNSKQKNHRIMVIDDHELVLSATLNVLKSKYPEAEIYSAQNAQEAINKISTLKLDLLVLDLAIPEAIGETAQINTGIKLLKTLMRQYPTINIVVQTAHPRNLIRLKAAISNHEGGFTVADKSLPMNEMLIKVDWSLKGSHCTPKEIRSGLEVKPEWLEVLKLAFEEGLQDITIGKRISVAERTVRHYWTKIYDVLGVYPDEGKNLRIQAEIRAREEGLID